MAFDEDVYYEDWMEDEMGEVYVDVGDYSTDPDFAEMLDLYEEESEQMTLLTLATRCMVPTLSQTSQSLLYLCLLCVIFRVLCIISNFGLDWNRSSAWILHISSATFGTLALRFFFKDTLVYPAVCTILSYFIILITSVRWRSLCGVVTSVFIVLYLLVCELYLVNTTTWHEIRGAQMVLSMKIISVAFDVANANSMYMGVPGLLEYLGYCFNVGTVIFGPWISFLHYQHAITHDKSFLDLSWIPRALLSSMAAAVCLLHSTCVTQWMILDSAWKWLVAYRDAQSFRFSHYFISFLSEVTAVLSGLRGSSHSDSTRWSISVSKPWNIEFPRSLVEVVTNWNLPMHYWLKTYVFKTARPLGTFTAILLTYAASSLLHGLNFQLSAVLLSLGFYSYVEYVLRQRLAAAFSACIQAKRCPPDCGHSYTQYHPAVVIVNLAFGALSVFHLAYLGLMFDSSPEEEKGYTMQHTLAKWAKLDYASHWTALATFLFYKMI